MFLFNKFDIVSNKPIRDSNKFILCVNKNNKNFKWLDSPIHAPIIPQWWSNVAMQYPHREQWWLRKGKFDMLHFVQVFTGKVIPSEFVIGFSERGELSLWVVCLGWSSIDESTFKEGSDSVIIPGLYLVIMRRI